jgi:hypothetical protein
MKTNPAILLMSVITLLSIVACSIQKEGRTTDKTLNSRLVLTDTSAVKDSLEYDLLIFDSGFEYWLNAKALSRNQYSNQYLSTMNHMYVTEWNRRYSIGDRRIESYIDYSPFIEYDFELNYKLFMYFKYFEETYNTRLIPSQRP